MSSIKQRVAGAKLLPFFVLQKKSQKVKKSKEGVFRLFHSFRVRTSFFPPSHLSIAQASLALRSVNPLRVFSSSSPQQCPSKLGIAFGSSSVRRRFRL
jgi:hypothetical protein